MDSLIKRNRTALLVYFMTNCLVVVITDKHWPYWLGFGGTPFAGGTFHYLSY